MKFVMDERLKHRLTGVVVILAIAAIFVPAVMKKSNQHFEEKLNFSVRLPPRPILPDVAVTKEKAIFQTVKVAHVDIPAVVQVPRLTQIAKAEPLSVKSSLPAAPIINVRPALAKVDVVVGPAVKAASAPRKLAKVSSRVKKAVYAVQIASFTQKVNAQSLVTRLRSKGFNASYSKFSSKQGAFYKVTVGELNQKDEAINLQKKLVLSMQLNGFIIKTDVS